MSKIYLFSFGGTNFCCLNILRVKIINVKNLMSFKWFPPQLFTAVRKRLFRKEINTYYTLGHGFLLPPTIYRCPSKTVALVELDGHQVANEHHHGTEQ